MKLIHSFVCVCIVFSSCDKSPRRQTTLNWDGTNQFDSIHWKIDGEVVGQGVAGYAEVISKLGFLDKGSTVTITYPSELWNEGVDHYVLHDVLPFASHDDLRKQFQELMLRKDIGIKHKPY